MAFFNAPDGARLHYEVEGAGEPVILHLGAGCDSELWRVAGYVDGLSGTNRCVLFDHRGHGKSDHPLGSDANHLDRYVEDVVALQDELGIASASFWGYSTAMLVGLALADRHPSRVTRLVMSGTLARMTVEQLAATTPHRVAELRDNRWELMIAGFEREEVRPVPDWMKERIRATAIEPVIAWRQARPRWGWDPWEAMPRISTPTLFIVGELEDTDDVMGDAAAAMPDASCVVLPGLGHINAFLRSDLTLQYVERFLAARAAAGATD